MFEVYKEKNSDKPLISIIIIDSRSMIKPEWVEESFQSAIKQNIPIEVIVINNTENKKTIGECWNEGVRQSETDLVFFLGDDDYISFDLMECFYRWYKSDRVKDSNIVSISSYMTAFDEDTKKKTALARQHTGMWKKEYLLKYPFNETLKKGIDREYIEEAVKRGELILIIEDRFSYYYRRHSLPHCAGDIIFTDKPSDYLFVTSNRQFLHTITERLSKAVGGENIFVSPSPHIDLLKEAKMIWTEWANEKAIEIANFQTHAYKILRLHAYEAFSEPIKKLNLNAFDKVIFIDDYIKEYVERQFGKVKGAVVIPNGVEIDKYVLSGKGNNKIAFGGYLSRKKGIGELLLLAKSISDYEFHLAGRYQEDDVADYLNLRKPDNVFVHEWKYESAMNEFYKDKSFVLNTSLRESQAMTVMEGMATGCTPIVRNWLGADRVYKSKWLWESIEDVKKILENPTPAQECREFIANNYDIKTVYPKIEELILSGVTV